jgi:C4-dicarboxylate-specific signal transduction histidine kinase
VEFAVSDLEGERLVPRSLFDGVAENLLQNALAKRGGGNIVRVQVTIKGGAALELRVCDSGAAVAADIAKVLFRAPVPSSTGLGIGLYQVARRAESGGFVLTLVENRDGEVCFVLSAADTGIAG